jgi:hypothetical protein
MSNLYQEVSNDAYSVAHSVDIEKLLSEYPPANTSSQKDNGISNVIDFVGSLISGDTSGHTPSTSKSINAYATSNDNASPVTIQTLMTDNPSSEFNFVALTDVSSKEMDGIPIDNAEMSMPEKPLHQLYLAGAGILGLFILYRLMRESK